MIIRPPSRSLRGGDFFIKPLYFYKHMLYLTSSMATNAKIEKTNNESSAYLLRKFVRKVQGTGLTQIMRAKRYFDRPKSSLRMKRSAMHRLEQGKKYDELRKLGKIN